ncbi:MAG: hypothetical protein ACI4TM_01560 [Candidatus Cryptobacteroides sp.]
MNTKQKSVRQHLREMKVGDVIRFPLDKVTSIRSACSAYSLEWDKGFETLSDRETRTVSVTRTR